MPPSKRLPRHIIPESIREGDLIRVTWTVGDVEHSRTGRVHKVHQSWGDRSRLFVTVSGNEIFRYIPYGNVKIRVTLIENAPPEPEPTLFDSLTIG